MADVLIFLTSLALLLLVSIIAIAVSKRTTVPLPLVLFIFGIILAKITYYDAPLIRVPGIFLSSFSIVALVIIMFDAISKIRFNHLDTVSKEIFRFFILALILNVWLISALVKFFFGLQWFVAVIFALLISCVEFNAIYPRHHAPKNRITQMLQDESVISCAFILLIPFLVLGFVSSVQFPITITSILPFFVALFAGAGAGIIVALILFRLLHFNYLERFSSLIIAVSILLGYVVAENINGSGFVAVAAMALVFGNMFFRQKLAIKNQVSFIDSIIEVFLFLFTGLVVGIPFSMDFIRISLGAFTLYLVIRFVSAHLMLRNHDFAERTEVALFVPKGLATVALAFALLNYTFVGSVLLVQLLAAFFVYSLVLDFILDKIGLYKNR